jgi:hypothetical protein
MRVPKESDGQPGWTVDPPPAVHPVLSIVSAATWEDLNRYGELFLGKESFGLGVGVGIAGALASGVSSLLSLIKTFDLEGVYELVHHPPPLGNPALLPPYGIAQLVKLALGDRRLDEAHAQCVAMLGELKHILENPKKFLRQLGEHYEQDYAAKWANFKEQLSHRTLIGDFEAGRITGQVLLDVIMILLTVYGAAELIAKVAAEIPELVNLVRGLRGAEEVLQVKKASVVAAGAGDVEAASGIALDRPTVPPPAEPAATPPKPPSAELGQEAPPKLPRIRSYIHGQSDGGPGVWGKPTTPRNALGQDYQQLVTGAPPGTEYKVPLAARKSGCVDFDGYDPERNVLLEAKDLNDWPVQRPEFLREKAINKLADEAKDQLAAAKGTPIEWHVPTEAKANEIQDILDDRGYSAIRVVVTPKP